jgi:pimeloyl-ACP methyl ester carboxylesterase
MTNLDALSQNYKVYAPDFWGFGYSTREPLDYGYDLFVNQVRLFMDSLSLDRATLIGHSMGGGTAIVFSVKYPERVKAAVLLGGMGIPRKLPLRGRFFMLPILAEFLLELKSNAIRKMNLRDYWIHRHELFSDEVFEKLMRFQKIKGTTEGLLTILRKDFFSYPRSRNSCSQ